MQQTTIDLTTIHEYYQQNHIIEKIIHQCRYREVVIIKRRTDRPITIRPLKMFKPSHFKYWYSRLELQYVPFDFYISNASVKLPTLPSDLQQLKHARKIVNSLFMDNMTGYDFFVDLDPSDENDEQTLEDYAETIKQSLLEQGLGRTQKFELYATGSGGIHLILKGKFDPLWMKTTIMDIACENNIPMKTPIKHCEDGNYVAEDGKWRKIQEDEKIKETPKPFLDNSIYDYRRIRRVPYSIHSKTGKPMRKINR